MSDSAAKDAGEALKGSADQHFAQESVAVSATEAESLDTPPDTVELDPSKIVSDWVLFRFFLQYVHPQWKLVLRGLLAVPFSIGATLLLPWLIIRIVDEYIIPGDLDGLTGMGPLLGATLIWGYLADSVYTFSMQKTGQLAISSIRTELFAHILNLPRKFFDQRPLGVVLTRLTTDMEALNDSLAVGVLNVFTDLLKTAALLILLFLLSWELTLVVLLIIPPIYLITNFLRSRLRYHYNLARETLASATGFLQECLNGVKTIQLYASETRVQKSFSEKTEKFLKAQNRSNFYDATLFSVIEGVISIALGLMIWHGAGQILQGVVTIGILVGFINTLNRIFIPIREFTQQISVFQRGFSSLENIYLFFSETPEETEPHADMEAGFDRRFSAFEELVFEEVWFRYNPDAEWILKGISFRITRGDRIAIVGATGSGKSTILRILTRMYGNYHGSIRLNGVEVTRIPRIFLNRMISLMQQDSFLFDESIAFNIALNRPGIREQEIRDAACYVYADRFIEKLPSQYDYRVKQNGGNLSAGEGRLLVFARAIAGKSEMIILDEATSSVDSVTESLIQQAIERIFKDKTVIAIAHRISTIRHSDQIFVLDAGRIAERGDHKTLMEARGLYSGLISQLKEEHNPS